MTMNQAMNKGGRESRVGEIMEATGVSRAEAEFILAQELGEIDGDVIVVVDPPVGPYSSAADIRAWLAELRGHLHQTVDVKKAIQDAEEWLQQAK